MTSLNTKNLTKLQNNYKKLVTCVYYFGSSLNDGSEEQKNKEGLQTYKRNKRRVFLNLSSFFRDLKKKENARIHKKEEDFASWPRSLCCETSCCCR